MDSWVGRVEIRLRVPAALADHAEGLRAAVQRDVVVGALETLERRVHARFGQHAIVRIRALSAAWRFGVGELANEQLVTRLGEELSSHVFDQVAAMSGPDRLRPRGQEVALFEDVAHMRAALLADAAEGRADSWVHAGKAAADVWSAILADGPRAVLATVRWLEQMDVVVDVVTVMTRRLRTAVFTTLPPGQWSEAARRAVERVRRSEVSPHGVIAPDRAPGAALPRGPNSAPATLDGSTSIPGGPGGPHRARVVESATSPPTAPAVEVGRASADHSPVNEVARPLDSADSTAVVEPPADGAAFVEVKTELAGLFYLVNGVFEIGLAERLWAAGLPEGDILAHVAATIVGNANVPAVRWFGGAFDRELSAPTVADWALDEVREQTMHGLGLQLARRGADMTPAQLDAALGELASAFAAPAVLGGSLAELVRRSAAMLAMLAAARMKQPAQAQLLVDVCTRPGSLRLSETELIVAIPAGGLDLDLRRAGLDRDPGDVPWLGRRLSFVFEGLDEL